MNATFRKEDTCNLYSTVFSPLQCSDQNPSQRTIEPSTHTKKKKMSQEQPRRPRDNENQPQDLEHEPITFGDVFPVTGGLADKPVAPQDAAMMQTAEATAFRETQTGGPADLMASAAARNERAGLVDRSDVTITGTEVPGACLVPETFAGQVVGQHVQVAVPATDQTQAQAKLTIGEAMEATMKAAGDKPVEYSDAAAIAEAEMRATGQSLVMQGGHAASAQSAAAYNTGIISDRDKIKLRDVVVVIVMPIVFI